MQYIILECNLRLICRFVTAHNIARKRIQKDVLEVNIKPKHQQVKHDKMQREWKIFKSVLFTLTLLPMTWFLMKFR